MNNSLAEKELEVLSTAWAKLSEASRNMLFSLDTSDSERDFTGMDDKPIKKMLKKDGWKENDIKFLLASEDRNAIYRERLEHRRYESINKSILEYYDYLDQNRIFMNGDIKQAFLEASSVLRGVMETDAAFTIPGNYEDTFNEYRNTALRIETIRDRIEGLVQDKLINYPF